MLPILRPYLLRVFPDFLPPFLAFFIDFLHVSSFTSFLLNSYLTFSICLPFFLASFLLPLLPPLLFTFFIPFFPLFTFIHFLPCLLLSCFLSSFLPLLHLCLCLPSLLTCSFLFFFSFLLSSFPYSSFPFFPFLLIHFLAALLFAFSVLMYSLPSFLSSLFTFPPSVHLSFLHLPLLLYSCIYISAGQQFISVNCIQNKSFCLHSICVFCVYVLCIYKYKHMHVYI